MLDLKTILDNVKLQYPDKYQQIKENSLKNNIFETPKCIYLTDEGSCFDGCSCSNVSIEQNCPFLKSLNFESCCCFQPDQ